MLSCGDHIPGIIFVHITYMYRVKVNFDKWTFLCLHVPVTACNSKNRHRANNKEAAALDMRDTILSL